eukprot:15588233-Heterocapsa_arctica.AAC.1
MVNNQQLQNRLYGPDGDEGDEGTWMYKNNSGHTVPKNWYNARGSTCCQDTYSVDKSDGLRKAMQKGRTYRHPKGSAGSNNSYDQACKPNGKTLQHSLYKTSEGQKDKYSRGGDTAGHICHWESKQNQQDWQIMDTSRNVYRIIQHESQQTEIGKEGSLAQEEMSSMSWGDGEEEKGWEKYPQEPQGGEDWETKAQLKRCGTCAR